MSHPWLPQTVINSFIQVGKFKVKDNFKDMISQGRVEFKSLASSRKSVRAVICRCQAKSKLTFSVSANRGIWGKLKSEAIHACQGCRALP
jgi:hypothetical protein